MLGLGKRIAEGQVAFMLLTRLPAGTLSSYVPDLAAARWAFPLVGIVIGGIIGCAYLALSAVSLPPLLAALCALALGLLATGALHEDGLADSADGFGGGHDRDRKLAIMKDSHIGSYGVLALIMIMGARLAALSALAADLNLVLWVISCAMFSRLIMVGYLCFMPSARDTGLGNQASGHRVRPLVIATILCLPVFWLAGPVMIACFITMGVVAILWGVIAMRQIGGQTGDVCGAGQMLCETAGWISLLLVMS